MVGGATAEGARPFADAVVPPLVHTLNVGTVAGLPFAVACYFLANRLLPVAMPGRAEAEIQAFLRRVGGGGSPRPGPRPRRAWIVALATVAVAYLLVPLVGGLREGGTVSVAFDVIVLGIGAGFGFAVHALAKSRFDRDGPGRTGSPAGPSRRAR